VEEPDVQPKVPRERCSAVHHLQVYDRAMVSRVTRGDARAGKVSVQREFA